MRLLLIAQIFLATIISSATLSYAADISVRGGDHDEYSRIVFDWPKAVNYNLQKSGDKLRVDFKSGSGLDSSKLEGTILKNITAVNVLGTNPLSVELLIPSDSRFRDLKIGSRVIIDVYNSPSGAKNTKPVNNAKPVSNAPPAPSQSSLESAGSSKIPPARPVPKVEPAEVVEKKPMPESNVVQLKAHDKPTIISMSSAGVFSLSSFVNAGRIWIVADKNDPLLVPQVSGPLKDNVAPMKQSIIDDGKAYVGNYPSGLKSKGQGGGVLWRVLSAADIDTKDEITPIRAEVNPQIERGGKLLFPLKSASKVIELEDDLTGDRIFAVAVEQSQDFVGAGQSYIDFDILYSPVGMAVRPKVDDLEVSIIRGGVEISRPKGLSLSDESKVKVALQHAKSEQKGPEGDQTQQHIFNFNSWRMGGPEALRENRTVILSRLIDMDEAGRAENLMVLGRAYLANNMPHEALGVFNYALRTLPDIGSSPEFLALTGASKALARHSEEAFGYLSIKQLQDFPEVNLWRAFALADLGDWQQAAEVMPQKAALIMQDYPDDIRYRIALNAAEIALRSGNTQQAEAIMSVLDEHTNEVRPSWEAAYQYLRGEKLRQEGQVEKTRKIWSDLSLGTDRLYRARAGLALTRLMMETDKLSPKRAIDRLERLRYAWRGDDLEAQINYWLGRIYFERGDHLKGLNIMRDATTYASHSALAQRIANDMGDTFVDLFVGGNISEVSPLDAITLYEQFTELVPPTERGDKVVEELAEHLVASDLLGRAGDLLEHQVDHRLKGYEAYRIAKRLAAIRLIDNLPDEALKIIDRAEELYTDLPEEEKLDQYASSLDLLRARALSRQGRPDQALSLLIEMDRTPEVNRLSADIAWSASYWDDAAEALGDVILDQDISPTRPLSDENKSLLIQRAVALNLANDRVALANMRERYSEPMSQTDKAKVFEVITRPRQNITLSDRETLLSIVSEVDLFSDVLDGIKDGNEG